MAYLDSRTPNASDVLAAFANDMRRYGLIPPNDLVTGRIQRCPVEGARRGKRDGAYLLFLDERPAGGFGHWKGGWNWQTWRYGNGTTQLTPAERAAGDAKVAALKKADEEKRLRLAEAARHDAVAWFGNACPAEPRHPYLVEKQVRAHGLRQRGDELLVPRRDMVTGEMVSLQRILPDGDKLSRSKIYALFDSGELRPIKVGRRTLLARSELESFLARRQPRR
jgi:putative DNA primase/helicase